MDTSPILQAEELCFSYGKNKILDHLFLTLEKGSCSAILGRNGSGKSTLLSLLAGCHKPDGGRIILGDGVLPGYVPQDNPFVEELNGKDNLKLRWLGPSSDFDKALHAPELTMLDTGSLLRLPVRKMSGGMKKRLSFACALINRPPLLLLDEPGSFLDLPLKQEMRGYLRRYLASGGSVLLATHDEADLSLCSAVFLLKDGGLSNLKNIKELLI